MFYFLIKLIFKRAANSVNDTKNIISVEQIILDDKIIERVIKQNNTQNITELKFKDICNVKEDKYNLYLFINEHSAMILVKSKMDNVEGLKQIINKNNLEKSI